MAVPVQLEIFMKDLTKAGLQSVGKNVDDVENQTLQLIEALKQVRAEQIKQLEANKQAGKSYTQEAANVQALTGQINGLKTGLKDKQPEDAVQSGSKRTSFACHGSADVYPRYFQQPTYAGRCNI